MTNLYVNLEGADLEDPMLAFALHIRPEFSGLPLETLMESGLLSNEERKKLKVVLKDADLDPNDLKGFTGMNLVGLAGEGFEYFHELEELGYHATDINGALDAVGLTERGSDTRLHSWVKQ